MCTWFWVTWDQSLSGNCHDATWSLLKYTPQLPPALTALFVRLVRVKLPELDSLSSFPQIPLHWLHLLRMIACLPL